VARGEEHIDDRFRAGSLVRHHRRDIAVAVSSPDEHRGGRVHLLGSDDLIVVDGRVYETVRLAIHQCAQQLRVDVGAEVQFRVDDREGEATLGSGLLGALDDAARVGGDGDLLGDEPDHA
jgi:hypothetical protein